MSKAAVAAEDVLPEDCWELVLRRVANEDENVVFERLSLVSKLFFSLTNRLRSSFAFSRTSEDAIITLRPLFSRFPNLTSLDVSIITHLSKFLPHLISINLTGCELLTNLSFITLTTNCPSLTHIDMKATSIGNNNNHKGNEKKDEEEGIKDYCSMDFVAKNSQVKSLYLADNPMLTDQSIKMFASICPNLELLDLQYTHIYLDVWSNRDLSKGVVEVLKICPKIRHLILARNPNLRLFGMNFLVPRLEVLDLSESVIDDSSLLMIARRSCGLLRLNLSYCYNITTKGVKRAIKNADYSERNLWSCHNVAASVVAWMVFARPALRRIAAPRDFRLSEILKEDERFKIVELLD